MPFSLAMLSSERAFTTDDTPRTARIRKAKTVTTRATRAILALIMDDLAFFMVKLDLLLMDMLLCL